MKLLVLITMLLASSVQAATHTFQSFIKVRGGTDRFVVTTTIDDQSPIGPLNPTNPSIYISTVLTRVTVRPFLQNDNIWPGIGNFAEFTQNPETLFIPVNNMFSSIENSTHSFHEVNFLWSPGIGFPIESTNIFSDLLNGNNLEDFELQLVGSIRNNITDRSEFRFDALVVPLPASLWLFGTAIIGLAGVSRRRDSKVNYKTSLMALN